MGIASVQEANRAAFRRLSFRAESAAATQRQDPLSASSSQQTEAEKQLRDLGSTWKNLPKFVTDDRLCDRAYGIILADLVECDLYLRSEPQGVKPADAALRDKDAALRDKLVADIRAQHDRISPETLNRLANAKDMLAIRDERERCLKEVNDQIASGSPTELTKDCLLLQSLILSARKNELFKLLQQQEPPTTADGDIARLDAALDAANAAYEAAKVNLELTKRLVQLDQLSKSPFRTTARPK